MLSARTIFSEFSILVADDWRGRIHQVVRLVEAAGAEVRGISEDQLVIAGIIERRKFARLAAMECARDVLETLVFVAEGVREPGADGSFGSSN